MTFWHRFNPLFVVLVATIIIAYQMFADPLSTPVFDALGYLTVTVNLDVHGVFSSAYVPPSAVAPEPNMFFAPFYPAVLVAIAKLSPDFTTYAACVVQARGVPVAEVEFLCPHGVNAAIIFQCALAILSSVLVYIGASLIFGKKRHAWLAMILAIATGEYAYYATLYLTENLVFPLFSLATILIVYAWRKPGLGVWSAAGATLGLLALVRPSFLYLVYFVLFYQLTLFAFRKSELNWVGASRLAVSITSCTLVVGPLVLHNWLVHGIPAISDGYASHILVQRVAYNAMTLNEWLVSWIYWLPDFGDSWAAYLFPPELYDRLTFHHPSSFYLVGNTTLRASTLAEAGDASTHLDYLLKEYVLEEIGKHLMVTLALAWRGIWISKYPGLVLLLLFIPVLISQLRRRRYELFVYALPALFMLGFHAFVSVSIPRYNLIMIPALAAGSSVVFAWLAERIYGVATRFLGVRTVGD